jgi:protein-tyrosine phosphatase
MRPRSVGVDADEIHPFLWQGARPPDGGVLSSIGFHTVVFCAVEFQPQAYRYPGVKIILAPNEDNYYVDISKNELRIAARTARQVADLVSQRRHVLVTCQAGRNRSGLVNALALRLLTGAGGLEAIQRIQGARPTSLENPYFVSFLERIKPHLGMSHLRG